MSKVLVAVFLCVATALAQDVLNVDFSHHVVVFENEHLRVLIGRYAPGEKSPLHERPPALTIALTGRREQIRTEFGEVREVRVRPGQIVPMEAGKRTSENVGDEPFEVLWIEYKSAEARQSVAGFERQTPKSPIEANEASALSALRTINTAQVTFAATYNRGFTDGLNRLGESAQGQPNVENADLVDSVLAGRASGGSNFVFVKNGYAFTYRPGSPSFGTVTTYSVTARPLKYGASGRRSFYTDESAVMRFTEEDRAATSTDRPI